MEIKKQFRVIVAGSRNFNDYDFLKEKLDRLLINKIKDSEIIIVSGTAYGADKLGEKYAKERGFKIHRYPADWGKFGKAAGYIRNIEMLENADACIVFRVNNSKGSTHMIDIAKEKNIPLRYYDIYDTRSNDGIGRHA